MISYSKKIVLCLTFGVTILVTGQSKATGVPISDFSTIEVISLYSVEYKADQKVMFQHKSGCKFLARTFFKNKALHLSVDEMVCNDLAQSLEKRTVQHNQNIRAGDKIIIPVGLVDFIKLNVQNLEES